MLTRPFTRLVVAFGHRRITQRQLVEETVLGLWILVPLGFLVGLLTSRICAKVHFNSIRSDVWTTIVVFLVGDVLMEWLLPSLSCLPLPDPEADYHYGWMWLLQSYGMRCPVDYASHATLLSPDATAILFSLRLIFLCLGVHIGESICFCAITGGIATGKSSVSQLLVDYNDSPSGSVASGSSGSSLTKQSYGIKRKQKRGGGNSGHGVAEGGTDNHSIEDHKEGTVTLICADKIAHQILLPPWVLAHEEAGPAVEDDNDDDNDDDGNTDDKTNQDDIDEPEQTTYLVHPSYSVYHQVIAAFGRDEIVGEDGRIDRLKLGAIVFRDPEKRRQLNRITHPKIMLALLHGLFRGVFFGRYDLTIADIPLLFESGKLSWLFAVTICVSLNDTDIQLERLQKRNPELSLEECKSRVASQMPLSKKARMADIVIDNSGDFEDLKKQVENVRRDLMGRLYGIGMSLLQMLLLIGGSTSIAVSSKFYSHWQQ